MGCVISARAQRPDGHERLGLVEIRATEEVLAARATELAFLIVKFVAAAWAPAPVFTVILRPRCRVATRCRRPGGIFLVRRFHESREFVSRALQVWRLPATLLFLRDSKPRLTYTSERCAGTMKASITYFGAARASRSHEVMAADAPALFFPSILFQRCR